MKAPPHTRITWEILHEEDCWSAELYCTAAQIFRGRISRKAIGEIGNCLEGWRVSTQSWTDTYDRRIEKTPIYRQANLDCMQFRLNAEQWEKPTIEAEWCVQPGDVVLNKIPPVRAAVVTSRLPRHPVDANCILIRGVKYPFAVWVALCLNQKPYEAYLLHRQGAATLPRVSLKVLSNLHLPLPPIEDASLLQGKVWDCNDDILENNESLMRLLAEVEAYVADEEKQLDESQPVSNNSLSTGRFFPADSIDDSLLPNHVQLSHRLHQLKQHLGWVSLAKLLSVDEIERSRLHGDVLQQGRYLRLSDIRTDLSFSQPEETENERSSPAPNRVYRQPLTSGEVLLSTLVSNPRVAFINEALSTKIYVTDHLERLRFKETPGAWALVLNTTAIRTQLEAMAMGTVQQFTHPANIPRLTVPNVPLELRQRWEKLLRRHHQRQRELNEQWQVIWNYAQTLFEEVHQ
ncbi:MULTISPECIES: hypothetical protein [Calothrix]|uniref:Restriction endonuclease subunit S n=2 Tax=Calothrix TaxID=1186 RepID=A0ABR8AGB6_9CYAN|nr:MULTISPECIES: hypothetical protein [Calothrix]MBD2198555.1 hypothetical protein [Calothrix parietina FACHB-288]MBD2226990.1 hypothetical protein [Calothrix anomala FACHB-343]